MDETIKVVVPYHLGDGMEDTAQFENELTESVGRFLMNFDLDVEVVVEWKR